MDTDLPYEPAEGVGMLRYRKSFPLPTGAPIPSLGEGNTPLVEDRLYDKAVFFKCEYLNPTGSFKDRGAVVLVAALLAQGVEAAVEDSSGNAGAAFAAYAARAGIQARVFIPDYASGPKRRQIEFYGAEVVRILGPRSNTAKAVRREAEGGAVYASHVYMPHGLAGMATVAFEIVEALGSAPGSVVIPVGQGSLLLGLYEGFRAMTRVGVVGSQPVLVGVQAAACAPLYAVNTGGAAALGWVQEGETLAEGIRIIQPVRGDAVLQAVESTGGRFIAVDEPAILEGRKALGQRGFYVEHTSAVVWPALLQEISALPEPVVVILTGIGHKSPGDT